MRRRDTGFEEIRVIIFSFVCEAFIPPSLRIKASHAFVFLSLVSLLRKTKKRYVLVSFFLHNLRSQCLLFGILSEGGIKASHTSLFPSEAFFFCFYLEGIPNNNQEGIKKGSRRDQEGIKKGYWYLFFEGITEVCEAFIPPSHRILVSFLRRDNS